MNKQNPQIQIINIETCSIKIPHLFAVCTIFTLTAHVFNIISGRYSGEYLTILDHIKNHTCKNTDWSEMNWHDHSGRKYQFTCKPIEILDYAQDSEDSIGDTILIIETTLYYQHNSLDIYVDKIIEYTTFSQCYGDIQLRKKFNDNVSIPTKYYLMNFIVLLCFIAIKTVIFLYDMQKLNNAMKEIKPNDKRTIYFKM